MKKLFVLLFLLCFLTPVFAETKTITDKITPDYNVTIIKYSDGSYDIDIKNDYHYYSFNKNGELLSFYTEKKPYYKYKNLADKRDTPNKTLIKTINPGYNISIGIFSDNSFDVAETKLRDYYRFNSDGFLYASTLNNFVYDSSEEISEPTPKRIHSICGKRVTYDSNGNIIKIGDEYVTYE